MRGAETKRTDIVYPITQLYLLINVMCKEGNFGSKDFGSKDEERESAYKPGSVKGSHSSGMRVTTQL